MRAGRQMDAQQHETKTQFSLFMRTPLIDSRRLKEQTASRPGALSDTMTVCYVKQINLTIKSCYLPLKHAGHNSAVVAQLVEALRYKP
jgi:hypothetical protein